jgi:hypothetical protein
VRLDAWLQPVWCVVSHSFTTPTPTRAAAIALRL